MKTLKRANRLSILSTGTALLAAALLSGLPVKARADLRADTLQALQNHYSMVPTMRGEFLQFGPKGEESSGTFAIKRPGKVRFDYESPSPIEVVSNGLAVMVVNNKLKTFDSYPLKNTPLKLLLDDKFNIDSKAVLDVTPGDDATTIVLGDKQIFGDSVITLIFEPETFELKQWTIKDAQGKETTVLVFNVEQNVTLPNRLFQINKAQFKRTN